MDGKETETRYLRWIEPLAVILIAFGVIWYFLSGIPTDYASEENIQISNEEYSSVVEQ